MKTAYINGIILNGHEDMAPVTGGVDGCQCARTLKLIEQGKIDTTPLITHTYPLEKIAEAYELFEQRQDGVIKVAVKVSTINH